MSLYRASPADGVAWVTGASGGIGREVALLLAARGYAVAVTARREDELSVLTRELAGGKGRIVAFPADVTDEAAMAEVVSSIEREMGPLVLAVFNAGTYVPISGARIALDKVRKIFEVNVMGVVNGLAPALQAMVARGRGQVVLTGSVSAYFGLPAASAYGASKAALNNMAESLKHDLDKMNIRIQIVNPGFVDTPLTKKNRFAMPALVPVDQAGRRFVDGIERGGFEVTFPRRFTWVLKLLRILPMPLRYRIMHRAMGWDQRDISKDA
jgi:short-subunit dehydrogenase